MRYLFLIIIIAVINYHAAAQADSNSLKTKDYYLQKSKSKKTVAWVFIGAGAAAIIGGAIVATSSKAEDDIYTDFDKTITGGAFIVAGGVSCLISIPFFISSGEYKRKALSVSSGFQQIPMPAKGLIIKQPAINISVVLGH